MLVRASPGAATTQVCFERSSYRFLQSQLQTRPRLVARLRQRDHAAPELLTLAGVDVVFAHERELAVAGDAIDHDAGGQRLDRVAVAHRERPRSEEHTSELQSL